MTQLTPLMFGEVYGRVSMQIPHNRTVLALQNSFDQMKVAAALHAMGQHKFINLVDSPSQKGDIALSLYAGDGVVTKITDAGYAGGARMMPFVVPPFATRHVEMKEGPGILIECFPYLSRQAIDEDVKVMQRQLAAAKMVFARDDDRADNLRRLPDQTPAIIDGGAAYPTWEAKPQDIIAAAADWHTKVRKFYPVLYNPDYVYRQSDVTNYKLIDPPSTVYPITAPKEEKPATRRGWFDFFKPA